MKKLRSIDHLSRGEVVGTLSEDHLELVTASVAHHCNFPLKAWGGIVLDPNNTFLENAVATAANVAALLASTPAIATAAPAAKKPFKSPPPAAKPAPSPAVAHPVVYYTRAFTYGEETLSLRFKPKKGEPKFAEKHLTDQEIPEALVRKWASQTKKPVALEILDQKKKGDKVTFTVGLSGPGWRPGFGAKLVAGLTFGLVKGQQAEYSFTHTLDAHNHAKQDEEAAS